MDRAAGRRRVERRRIRGLSGVFHGRNPAFYPAFTSLIILYYTKIFIIWSCRSGNMIYSSKEFIKPVSAQPQSWRKSGKTDFRGRHLKERLSGNQVA